ncbi:MAG: ParB N-terminal domain-containing protein [Planctomycetia bacterium]|nr:ParB N-terminal domain-containing protein [Planctomycetia bacterium]
MKKVKDGLPATAQHGPPLHAVPVQMLKVSELVLHGQANRVPRMQKEERQAFIEDVKARGVQDAVVVQKPNIILDGRHRWEAAQERGDSTIPARVVDLDELGQLNVLYGQALLRRNQTDDQRAVVAAYWCDVQVKLSKQERAQKGGKAKQSKDSSANAADAEQQTHPEKNSANAADAKQRTQRADEKASSLYGVPLRKVRTAQQLVKEGRSLANQVLAGELKLGQAKRQLKGQAESTGKPKPGKKGGITLALTKPFDAEGLAKRLFKVLGKMQAHELEDALRAERVSE